MLYSMSSYSERAVSPAFYASFSSTLLASLKKTEWVFSLVNSTQTEQSFLLNKTILMLSVLYGRRPYQQMKKMLRIVHVHNQTSSCTDVRVEAARDAEKQWSISNGSPLKRRWFDILVESHYTLPLLRYDIIARLAYEMFSSNTNNIARFIELEQVNYRNKHTLHKTVHVSNCSCNHNRWLL